MVFVLETRPRHRVAHAHVVTFGDPQWCNYLRLRDRLRTDTAARETYAASKLALVRQFASDRGAYTAGKTDVIRSLLAE